MPRDYARKSRPQDSTRRGAQQPRSTRGGARHTARKPGKGTAPRTVNRQSGGLSLRWILSLAAVGGFIGFIAYLNSLPSQEPREQTTAVNQPKGQPQAVAPTKGKTKEEPGFRFYDMLPDSEVIPPQVEEYNPGPAEQSFSYLVQTGSFRSQKDAERQRAEIAFQGLRARVDQIDLDNGSIWFRVNVGPFNSRSQMNAVIDKLVSINIQPLVRRIPKDQG